MHSSLSVASSSTRNAFMAETGSGSRPSVTNWKSEVVGLNYFRHFSAVALLSARLTCCSRAPFSTRRGLAFRETIAGPLEEENKKASSEPRAIIRIVMGYRIITCRLSDGSVVDRVSRDRGNLNCFPAATFSRRF